MGLEKKTLCTCTDLLTPLNDDVLGLIVLKSGLDDPNSALSSWNEDEANPCSWRYVQCDPSTGRAVQLSLDGLSLSGKIGRGLEKVDHLQTLSLSNNNFSGSLDLQLPLFHSLRRLNLSGNSFSGPIPAEVFGGGDTSITHIDLSHNSFSGPVPDTLFRSSRSLRFVSLADNLLEGAIPNAITQCAFLAALNLSRNHLSGNPLGVFSTSLMKLRVLDLSHNSFSGQVPEAVSGLHNLNELYLQNNRFSGPVPVGLGLCPHLSRLDVSGNAFDGVLPDTLQRLGSLEYLAMANNRINGDLPWWIGNLTGLRYLDLSGNGFTGSIMASLGGLKSLFYLSFSENRLTGEIPVELSYCSGLSELNLKGCGLNGSIPQALFDLGLEEIDLSVNRLTGPIPPGTSRLFERLRRLDLSRNRLSGDIPPEMGLYFNLRYLNLSWNDLRSRLPPELGYFRDLSELDLRHSNLFGSIPGDLCDSNSLTVLQLDGNSLSGPIPEEIGNCSYLHLFGEIPQQLGGLENLLAVNISHNRLVGRLPMGSVFQTLDQTALQGNLGICSPLVDEPCKMDNIPKPLVLDPHAYTNDNSSSSSSSSDSDSGDNYTTLPIASRHKRFLSISAIVAISAALVILSGVVVVALLNVSARRRLTFIDNAVESMCSSTHKSLGGGGGGGPAGAVGKLVMFSPVSELRSEDWVGGAECLLDKASEIGTGVLGTVYKAYIGEGRAVAIKKLVTSNIIQYHDDFDREVRILGKARHPNIMPLKGYYWTPQLQLLISEYAPNESLHARLHNCSPSPSSSSGHAPLPWAIRFKIALGMAKGLAQLHHAFRPPIIHYNIKPSNILLDENFNARIADFGLARLLPKLDRHVISNRFQSALGYVAPELACQSLRINEKCDIYGFGVVVLELVTGRKPVEYGDDDVVILIDLVRSMLEQGNALSVVDPTMTEFPEEEVLPLLKLGLVCTSQIPSSRPSMAEVVQILQVIKTPAPERMEAY
ncbi:inactive leucine-rich repeat receptor-like protein kinase [Acorus gramineus]|uniref:Inactive leucine-rich repeat receptor-like protein kinase n=1 Tax=Acorus gramineus TaxID=55184 RepID=A0AAV9B1C9_ACOGR|nr:inactive leucine-rich repeat receptor-like protein kinase [Acorus gramineus]